MKRFLPALVAGLVASAGLAQDGFAPARLRSAGLGPVPYGTQSGGIAAFRVMVDAKGGVGDATPILEFAPYGDLMRSALPNWRFDPAQAEGKAVAAPVLVLGLFSPPAMTYAAPPEPRYRDVTAPDDVPWPTEVTVPGYPPNATGGAAVILEVDVTAEGTVAATRVVAGTPGFDAAAEGALSSWRFRAALRGNRDAAARIFVIVTFVGDVPRIG